MIEIKGLDALIKKTENLAADARKDTQTALNDFADRVASGAKQLVASNSSDEGKLLGSINAKYGDLSASVVVGANYAAFIEFGTRKFAASYVASLPQDWKTYAATFRGKSPDGELSMILFRLLWLGCKERVLGRVKQSQAIIQAQGIHYLPCNRLLMQLPLIFYKME